MSMTIFEAYNDLKKQLLEAGIEDFTFEAKQIIKHVTGLTNTEILTRYNDKLTEFQENNITAIIKQRLVRYPLQYIIGEWNFYGFSFDVGPGVLIPRADTETVIDVCKEFLEKKKDAKILDLCAGTGCIGITLGLLYKECDVTLVEKYETAAYYAWKNISKNKADNVKLIADDVLAPTQNGEKMDIIVSNPPYIPESEMGMVSPEVNFEPETALIADEEGMQFYKAIIENYKSDLNCGGMLCFEVGIGEAERVAALMREAGFDNVNIRRDMNDVDRVVFGTVVQI